MFNYLKRERVFFVFFFVFNMEYINKTEIIAFKFKLKDNTI